mgnify:CR=1 FL=1
MFNKSLFKNIATLAGGTAIGQALVLLSSPILTRLYTPEEFGFYAILISIVSIFTPAVCGKYDVSILIPSSEKEASRLFAVSIYFALSLSVFLLLTSFIIISAFQLPYSYEVVGCWLLMFPIILFQYGVTSAASYYLNKFEKYSEIATGKIIQAGLVAVFSIIFGLMNLGYQGLILGHVLGMVFSTVYFLHKCRPWLNIRVFTLNKELFELTASYKDYPIYNASTSLLNGLQTAAPTLFMSYYYGGAIAGLYSISNKVVNAPLSFISSAVSQVNLKTVIERRGSSIEVTPFFFKSVLNLMLVAILPVSILFFYGEVLFSFIFGEEWGVAGRYASVLAPALGVRFVASSLVSTLNAFQLNKVIAIINISITVTVLSVFYMPEIIISDVELIGKYSLVLSVFYLALLFVVYSFCIANDRKYEYAKKSS